MVDRNRVKEDTIIIIFVIQTNNELGTMPINTNIPNKLDRKMAVTKVFHMPLRSVNMVPDIFISKVCLC